MNFLKKTWVAIALTVIMVVAAIGVGQLRAPVPGLPTDTSNSASGAPVSYTHLTLPTILRV